MTPAAEAIPAAQELSALMTVRQLGPAQSSERIETVSRDSPTSLEARTANSLAEGGTRRDPRRDRPADCTQGPPVRGAQARGVAPRGAGQLVVDDSPSVPGHARRPQTSNTLEAGSPTTRGRHQVPADPVGTVDRRGLTRRPASHSSAAVHLTPQPKPPGNAPTGGDPASSDLTEPGHASARRAPGDEQVAGIRGLRDLHRCDGAGHAVAVRPERLVTSRPASATSIQAAT